MSNQLIRIKTLHVFKLIFKKLLISINQAQWITCLQVSKTTTEVDQISHFLSYGPQRVMT